MGGCWSGKEERAVCVVSDRFELMWTVNVDEDICDQNRRRRPQSYTKTRPAFSATSGVLREASSPGLHSLNPSHCMLTSFTTCDSPSPLTPISPSHERETPL